MVGHEPELQWAICVGFYSLLNAKSGIRVLKALIRYVVYTTFNVTAMAEAAIVQRLQ